MKKTLSSSIVTSRSVDNLQTLFTIVIALALVEAIKSIISYKTKPVSIGFNAEFLPTFVAFILTIIPFHHGANRYLDETYITRESRGRPLTGLIDFFFFFIEAMVFYVMALSIAQPKLFFFLLVILLGIDVIWLAFVYYSKHESFIKIKYWFWLNLFIGLIILYLNVDMAEAIFKWIVLVIIVFIRTVLDYISEWPFYWPAYDTADRANPGQT